MYSFVQTLQSLQVTIWMTAKKDQKKKLLATCKAVLKDTHIN